MWVAGIILFTTSDVCWSLWFPAAIIDQTWTEFPKVLTSTFDTRKQHVSYMALDSVCGRRPASGVTRPYQHRNAVVSSTSVVIIDFVQSYLLRQGELLNSTVVEPFG